MLVHSDWIDTAGWQHILVEHQCSAGWFLDGSNPQCQPTHFMASLWGPNYIKRVCLYEFFTSGWLRAGWRAAEMAPSVFDLYANWMKSWEEEERKDRLFVLHNQPLKALHDDGNQCYGLIVIKTELEGLLCYEYNGCGLETHWEMLKTSKSSPAQFLKTRPGILSCPAALRALILERILFTLAGAKQQCLCLPQCYCCTHSPTMSPASFHKDSFGVVAC